MGDGAGESPPPQIVAHLAAEVGVRQRRAVQPALGLTLPRPVGVAVLVHIGQGLINDGLRDAFSAEFPAQQERAFGSAPFPAVAPTDGELGIVQIAIALERGQRLLNGGLGEIAPHPPPHLGHGPRPEAQVTESDLHSARVIVGHTAA